MDAGVVEDSVQTIRARLDGVQRRVDRVRGGDVAGQGQDVVGVRLRKLRQAVADAAVQRKDESALLGVQAGQLIAQAASCARYQYVLHLKSHPPYHVYAARL